MNNNHHLLSKLVILSALLGMIMLVTYFTLRKNTSSILNTGAASIKKSVIPTPIIKKQKLFFLKSDKDNYKLGETVALTLLGDSLGQTITGFDALLDYDDKALKLLETKVLLSQFRIYPSLNNGRLSTTGIQNLTDKTPIILSETPLVTYFFETLKTGKFYIRLVSQRKTERSQLITNQSKRLEAEEMVVDLIID